MREKNGISRLSIFDVRGNHTQDILKDCKVVIDDVLNE